jgi:hypothetical protein
MVCYHDVENRRVGPDQFKGQRAIRHAFNLVAHAGEREAGHFPELAHVVDVQDPLYIFSGDNLDGWE